MLTLKLTTFKRLISNVGLSFFVNWFVSFAFLIFKMLHASLLPFSNELNQRYWKTKELGYQDQQGPWVYAFGLISRLG